MDKTNDSSPFERLHIPDTFENVLRALVNDRRERVNERPPIELEPGEKLQTFMFDDIPEHTELKIVVSEEGKGESYVEYERPDGTIRRVLTLKGGGKINIRTNRV